MLYKAKNSFFRRAFPTPNYLSLSPVAIDITPFSIRVMRLKSSSVGFIPELYKEIRFDQPCDLTDEISDEEKGIVSDALRKLKQEIKFEYAIAALPEQRNYIFQTSLPVQAKNDITSAVKFSLEEYVPLEAKDLNFDFNIINEKEGSSEMDIIVSVYQKNLIAAYTDIFKNAGITPVSFLSESTAMSNSLIDCCDLNPYLIIRLMQDRINIVIVENSVVQYTSTMMMNVPDFIRDFSGQSAGELKSSLNKLLIYWFTNKHGVTEHKKIEHVLLTGEFADHRGVADFFEKNLKIHSSIGNVWKNAFAFDEYVPAISKEESMKCAVVVGLALAAIVNK